MNDGTEPTRERAATLTEETGTTPAETRGILLAREILGRMDAIFENEPHARKECIRGVLIGLHKDDMVRAVLRGA